MDRIFKIFFEPYPLEDDDRIQLIMNTFISCIVIVVLVIFKPFGLIYVNYQLAKLVPIYLSFGALTFILCLMADMLIKPAFPIFFDEQRWTVIKNIFWVVFLIAFIGTGILFLCNAFGFTGVSGSSLLSFLLITVSISLIPVLIITLVLRIALLRHNRRRVEELNKSLQGNIMPFTGNTTLLFTSESGRDQIKLAVDQFLFAESAYDYSDIVYIDNNIVKRELIRSTLKRIEEMNTHDFVLRVHRNFLVNLRKVKSVSGNSQGFRLVFENVEETVPVSRRSATKLNELLRKIHNS